MRGPDQFPVFIHSLPRSSSTYFYQAFSRSNPDCLCLQESLHEDVLKYAQQPQLLISERSAEADSAYRHPKLDGSYHSPLVKLWPSWQYSINKEDLYDLFFSTDPQNCGQDWWQSIIDAAGRRVVFEETRTFGRIEALKRRFSDSVFVYLHRNPVDQWFSQRAADYFSAFIKVVLQSASAPASIRLLVSSINFSPAPTDRNIWEQIKYHQQHPLAPEEAYLAFYLLWSIALDSALSHADILVNVNRLSQSIEYRSLVEKQLATYGLTCCFSDCRTPTSDLSKIEERFYRKLEKRAYEYLAYGGWKQSEIDRIEEIRSSHLQTSAGSNGETNNLNELYKQSTASLRSALLECERKNYGYVDKSLKLQARMQILAAETEEYLKIK